MAIPTSVVRSRGDTLTRVQVKDNNGAGRIKPFAHVLVGAARYTNRQRQNIDVAPQFNFTIEDRVTSFAMKLGGGLDLRAGRRFDLRLFEFDYNPVFAGPPSQEHRRTL